MADPFSSDEENKLDNFFDQFDDPAAAPGDPSAVDGANFFDQFDTEDTAPAPVPVQETPIEEDPSFEDYGRMIMSGGAQVGGGIGWLLEKMGADEVGGAIRERSMKSAEQWMKGKLDAVGLDQEGLSPQAKQAMQAEFLGEGTGTDKWNKAKLMTASSLLGTMAGMGVGSIFTKGLAAAGMVKATGEASKLAATIGYGAGEAAVAAPASGVSTEEEILQMKHEQLLDSPEYVAVLEGLDMPEAEAREKAKDILAKAAGGDAAALTMVSTFVLSAPFGNKLDEILSGTLGAAKGRVTAGLQGAGTEATQEFLQSGAEQLSANIALQDAQPDRSYGQDVLESAVGGAAAGGLMGGGMGLGTGPQAAAAPEDDGDNALNEIERLQQEAEARAREGGADPLEAAIEGARAASEAGSQVQGIFQEAAERQITDQEYAELADTPAAERTPVRKVAREKLIPEDEFARAEEADAASREAAQAEAAKTYERQQRAADAAPAEAQRAKQKEAEVQEAEYQRELQKGAEPQEPVNPLMAQRLEKAQQKDAAKKAAKEKVEERKAAAKAKAAADIEAAKQPAMKALPDLSPDVVVGKDGQAVTREQMAEERAKTQVDAAAGETPLRPSEIKLERRVGNVKIALETPEGVERTGKRADGSTWRTTMKGVDYGFVRGSTGAEGDQVDAFVNTQEDSNYDTVFVIDQVNQNTGEFDEHKVMVGFKNQAAAVKAYKQQYDKGWKVGPVTQMGQKKFESWVKEGKKAEPVGNIEVTPTVSPADVEAIQERQERKGRKKPKVMYRAGEKAYPIAPRDEWYGEADYEARGGTITEMTPDEFLATAAPLAIDEVARDNIDDLKNMMESGRTLDPLTLYKDKGTARDSDGRHRAIAAKELGMSSVPVVDFRPPGKKSSGKPKVMYRLPEGHSILMSEEEPTPGFVGVEITVEIADAEGNVVGGITAEVFDETKELKISISKVDESIRGQGAGLEMYNTLLQEAFRRGYKLTSDFSVSADAERIYQALERRGATVTRNPKATQNELGSWLSDDTRNPVFTVEPIDIRLRVEDLEGNRQFTVMDAQSGEELGVVTAADVATANDIGSRRYNTEVAVVENTEGDSLTDIIATAEGVMAAMPGLKGTVILDPLELPAELYEQMRDDGQLGAKGMFHVETGDIYIFAANHNDVVDVVRTILHEGVAHKGLRVVLADKLPGLLQDIWQNGDQAAIQKIADKYGLDTGNATDRMKATEEYVAHLAERTPEAPILRRITDAVRQFLRSIGFLNEWTDSDIHALLRDVKRELQGKPLNTITFTEDVTIEETGEVVQIEERADVMLRQMDKRMSVIEKLKGCLAA